MFPPAPTAMPRTSPKGGGVVCGKVVPERVSTAKHLQMYTTTQADLPMFSLLSASHPGQHITQRVIGHTRTITCLSDG